MATENIKTLAELIEQADTAAATTRQNMEGVQERLRQARANGGSVYNALLNTPTEQADEPQRIERAERLAKVQAIGDFVSAIGSGIAGLGAGGRGYVPATPNTAGRTIADMRNLQDLYKKRIENSRAVQAQMAAQQHESEIAGLEAEYARMAKELEKQEKRRDDLAKEQRTEENRIAAEQRELDSFVKKQEIQTQNRLKTQASKQSSNDEDLDYINVGNGEQWGIPPTKSESIIPFIYEAMVASYPETAVMKSVKVPGIGGVQTTEKQPIDEPTIRQQKQKINTYIRNYPELIKLLADELGIDYELPAEAERVPLGQLRRSVMTDSAGRPTDHNYAAFQQMKNDFNI